MVIPKDICYHFGWGPGDTVKVSVLSNGIFVEKAASGKPDELVKEGETVK